MNIPLNIDWQQILLHFFNFSILTGGLYLLLFKPVKDFMDKRKQTYEQMDAQARQARDEAQQLKTQAEESLAQLDKELVEKRSSAEKQAALYTQQQQQAARQQADKLLSDARAQAEQEGKRILAQANRDAVSLVESAMDKLADRQTGQAYDTFLAAAGGGEPRPHPLHGPHPGGAAGAAEAAAVRPAHRGGLCHPPDP